MYLVTTISGTAYARDYSDKDVKLSDRALEILEIERANMIYQPSESKDEKPRPLFSIVKEWIHGLGYTNILI